MKILVIGKEGRLQARTDPAVYSAHEVVYVPLGADEKQMLQVGQGAQAILFDAIARVPAAVIEGLPDLRMIHSEGVGYNGVDVEAAARRGVPVCNCKGMNAGAVAEQTLLLMLGLLRNVAQGDRDVRAGKQMEVKEGYMLRGDLRELADCTVGLLGFGDIARETARLCRAFGAKVLYHTRSRRSPEEEAAAGVEYREQEALLAESDIVSIHLPALPQTYHLADRAFFEKMRPGAMLINTARGELVDSEALMQALLEGRLSGAGLDCVDGEPVQADNPLLAAPPEAADKILYSCHIGGITASSFKRGNAMFWENVARVEKGEPPLRVVNGVH